jgi:hypothetical protein
MARMILRVSSGDCRAVGACPRDRRATDRACVEMHRGGAYSRTCQISVISLVGLGFLASRQPPPGRSAPDVVARTNTWNFCTIGDPEAAAVPAARCPSMRNAHRYADI